MVEFIIHRGLKELFTLSLVGFVVIWAFCWRSRFYLILLFFLFCFCLRNFVWLLVKLGYLKELFSTCHLSFLFFRFHALPWQRSSLLLTKIRNSVISNHATLMTEWHGANWRKLLLQWTLRFSNSKCGLFSSWNSKSVCNPMRLTMIFLRRTGKRKSFLEDCFYYITCILWLSSEDKLQSWQIFWEGLHWPSIKALPHLSDTCLQWLTTLKLKFTWKIILSNLRNLNGISRSFTVF